MIRLSRTGIDLTMVEIDGELSAYNPMTDRVVMLNVTASEVFALCDGTLDVDGIAGLLAATYDADLAEVRAGVGDAVALLILEGLVEKTGDVA